MGKAKELALEKNLRRAVLNYLARRDHSQQELLQKLAKDYLVEEIQHVLDELIAAGFINEIRYAENYINARRKKGYGPKRIALELEMRGIPDDIIAEQLKITDNAWLHDLLRLWQKHFKGQLAKDFKTKAKQMRFLYYRGFTQEQIEEVLKSE